MCICVMYVCTYILENICRLLCVGLRQEADVRLVHTLGRLAASASFILPGRLATWPPSCLPACLPSRLPRRLPRAACLAPPASPPASPPGRLSAWVVHK